LLVEVRGRYVSASELDAGLRLMRNEAKVKRDGWIDAGPPHFIAASKD
jgi:hypothetical protein